MTKTRTTPEIRELLTENELLRSRLTESQKKIAELTDFKILHSKLEKIEIASHENERKFLSLISSMNEGVALHQLIYDDEGKAFDYRITMVNHAYEKITGLKGESVIGSKASEVYGEYSALYFDNFKKSAESGESQVIEAFFEPLSRYFHVSVFSPLHGMFATVFTDITKHKSDEDALRLSESRFRSVLDNSRDIIYRLNLQTGRHEYISPSVESSGFSKEEISSMDIMDLLKNVHHEDIIPLRKSLLKMRETGEGELEYRQLNKNGEYRWISNNMVVIKDDHNNPLFVDGTIRDITNRKTFENILRESNEKLEVALEIGHIGLWEWNLKSGLVTCDRRTEEMLMLKSDTAKKAFQFFECCIHEEDFEHFKRAINQTLEYDQPFETVIRTKPVDNESRFLEIKGLVYKNSRGKPVKLSGVCFDVTGMKKGTEAVLIKLNEELMRSNKDLQQFAYVASHDLQEPLRMVSSFTQLIEQRYRDKIDDDGRQFIQFAVEGSRRMYNLINGLLAYSRIQARGREFGKVSMRKVLEKVKKNLELKIAEKKAEITVRRLPVLFADECQMIQLMQNLIDNSLKFSKGIPRITVSASLNKDQVTFKVRDQGIGIDPQYYDRIFQIFQRLMPREEYEGTGIGLAICKRIVERHGGNIWIESKPGEGSTFHFTIPKRNFFHNFQSKN
jgi:PAS domain S-box-containing protein